LAINGSSFFGLCRKMHSSAFLLRQRSIKDTSKLRAFRVRLPTCSSWLFAAAVGCGLVAATVPIYAQQHVGPDGFTICPFLSSSFGVLNSTIGPCQPLSNRTLESFGLSSSQTAIVETLQSFAAKPTDDLLQQMANTKSLAAPQQFAATGHYSDYWFPDSANPSNVELGIHLRYLSQNAKPELYQMTYTVDGDEGHFTVLWNRSALTTPPR
jgi:hypothetical protein